MAGLEARAVAVGAATAMALAVPAALLGQRVSEGGDGAAAAEPSNAVFVFFGAVLAAFLIGGYLAARQAPSAPYTNGAVAALLAYALVQGVGTALRLLDGEPVSVVQIVFNGLVAYAAGLLGGMVAAWRGARGARG